MASDSGLLSILVRPHCSLQHCLSWHPPGQAGLHWNHWHPSGLAEILSHWVRTICPTQEPKILLLSSLQWCSPGLCPWPPPVHYLPSPPWTHFPGNFISSSTATLMISSFLSPPSLLPLYHPQLYPTAYWRLNHGCHSTSSNWTVTKPRSASVGTRSTLANRTVVLLFNEVKLWGLRLKERSAQSTAKKLNKKACIKTNPNMISRFIV